MSDIIENPVTGERCRWLVTSAETGGRMTRGEFWVRPGGGIPELHVHRRADEHFEVLAGELTATVGGATRVLRAGERVDVPKGTPHGWKATGDEELHFVVEVAPAGVFERQIETGFRLAREGRVYKNGFPHLLPFAAQHRLLLDDFYPVKPPRWILTALFTLIEPFARWRVAAPAVATLLVALAVAGAAQAATLEVEGSTLVYTAAPGERNTPLFNENRTGSLDDWTVVDAAALTVIPAGCEYPTSEKTYVACHVPGITTARLVLGDGDDKAGAFSEWGARRFEVDAGPGDDEINGPDAEGSTLAVDAGDGDDLVYGTLGPDVIVGGTGNDNLEGREGDDSVDGGDGDDKVNGYAGDDKVLGGPGDDSVWGDNYESPGHDVIDGGAGYDTLESDYVTRDPNEHQPEVVISLGGGADDGRPGENDDVRGIEDLTTTIESGITGTDGPERLVVFQNLKRSALLGKGGDDDLKTSGGDDAIDGGNGDDTIDAGYGDDQIVAGPGKDHVFADLRGGDCSPLWCTVPYGNDTVDVRDGAVDSVSCGAGEDKVAADAADIVAPDCETVLRGGGGGSGCTVPDVVGRPVGAARRKLAKAGCRVAVRGRGRRVRRQSVKAGAVKPAGTVVTLRAGR